MTEEEQKLNWYAIMESGSMTAIHNIRQYISELEKENELLKIEQEHIKEDKELAKENWDELKEIKSFLCQLMLGTDAYDFWADECLAIEKKYYDGDLSKWNKEHDGE